MIDQRVDAFRSNLYLKPFSSIPVSFEQSFIPTYNRISVDLISDLRTTSIEEYETGYWKNQRRLLEKQGTIKEAKNIIVSVTFL